MTYFFHEMRTVTQLFLRVLSIVLFGAVANRSSIVVFTSGGSGFDACTQLGGWQIGRIREDFASFLAHLQIIQGSG